MQCKRKAGYARQIQAATGAPAPLLPILENIMREEIFHSTLDWQSTEEFQAAACQAYAHYRENSAFYDAEIRHCQATFHTLVATDRLREVTASGQADAIAEAEAALQAAAMDESAARDKLLNYLL